MDDTAPMTKPSLSSESIAADQIAATEISKPTLFSMKAQMLEQWRTDTVLAAKTSCTRILTRTMSSSSCKAAPNFTDPMAKHRTYRPARAS